jgi:4,5-DOPA dioxygenase extradiol
MRAPSSSDDIWYVFPPELYRVWYSVNTDIEWARELSGILEKNSIQNILNPNRGIDHGVWSVLTHLSPEANITIIQISVGYSWSPDFHYHLGEILSESYDDDTLFISSGNIVHNLRLLDWSGKSTPQWANDFDISIDEIIRSGEYEKITQYKNLPGSHESVPTPDHFYPFVTFLGASGEKPIESAYHGFELGSISTRIYKNF